MVNRKTKSRSKKRSIQLKRRSRKRKTGSRVSRSYLGSAGWSDFLDTTVSVRSLLKYSGITLAFVIILVSVFMLGRISARADDLSGSSDSSVQLSGQTRQVVKSGSDAGSDTGSSGDIEDNQGEADDMDNSSDDVPDEFEEANLSESGSSGYVPVGGYAVSDDPEDEEEYDAAPECENYEAAGFDYAYTKIGIGVSNFQRELRGDNWASLTSLKLTITNNEECTVVNPTRIKIKMNEAGKGSVWWDDDIFLPDEFKNMPPGKSVSAVVPVHVSYSDIYSEKDFRLALFDDYDIHMGTLKERMTFP